MDDWVIAAATSAGFIAKYWKHLLRNTNSLSSLSHNGSDFERHDSSFLKIVKPRNKRCPLHIFSRRNKVGTDVSSKEDQLWDPNLSEVSQSEVATGLEASCSCDDCIAYRPSSVKAGSLRSAKVRGDKDASIENDDIGNQIPAFFNWEMGYSHHSYRKSRSIRYKQLRVKFLQPVSSIESCLMAQLHSEHAEMEEYAFALRRSHSTSKVTPFFLTDGCQIINRAWDVKRLHKKPSFEGKGIVIGLPPLPTFESSKHTVKVKHDGIRNSTKAINGKHLHVNGSVDEYLICTGLAIGVISAAISSKREVNKLKEMLINTEDLVRDLQDELEMKDSLTVKELVDEKFEPQNTLEHSFHFKTPIAIMGKSRKYDDAKRGFCELDEDKAESMSNIEAELEAELERMEIRVNSSSLKAELSDLVELDPEFDTDIFQGESVAATVGAQDGVIRDSNLEYAVSPRELTLRLHELIQSRLEERIKELEAALENSQRKVRSMAMRSSSITAIPITIQENGITSPLMANDLENDSSTSGCGQNREYCNSMPFTVTSEQKPTLNTSRVEELKEVAATLSEDGNSDCDDEIEKLPIEQIVEKTKRSPVILNAQRLLFQFDED